MYIMHWISKIIASNHFLRRLYSKGTWWYSCQSFSFFSSFVNVSCLKDVRKAKRKLSRDSPFIVVLFEGLLRELVLSQQKTMFYTVTVSSTPPSLKDITKKIAPNLKVTMISCWMTVISWPRGLVQWALIVSYCCRGVPPAGRFGKQMELKQTFGVKEKDTMCRGGGRKGGGEGD